MNATKQDARPSGPEIRQQVFGAPTGKPTAPGGADPFLGPFFETAIEHGVSARRQRHTGDHRHPSHTGGGDRR